MSEIVIKVENLSKAYQLGQIGTGTISNDIQRWWATSIRGREDPFLKIGETNDRSVKGESSIVWSLNDINFEIKQGEAVGIIGRNGAGKSTLLKLLSRVTAPTSGNIKVKGRIASLLEVGTGFHPELTGRENIYLNGAILGMRKKEIARKFDEIVAFSGVERYIDTPVKRYSSGMYVRLAFAVAAHLESEILIVDEVLAVGDAEFQKKCLGKMGEVSKGEGRTVLFVSHNLTSVSNLCNTGIFLNNGKIVNTGEILTVLNKYVDYNNKNSAEVIKQNLVYYRKWEKVEFETVRLISNGKITSEVDINHELTIEVIFSVLENNIYVLPSIHLLDNLGSIILSSMDLQFVKNADDFLQKGIYKSTIKIPANFLNNKSYKVSIFLVDQNMKNMSILSEVLTFNVIDFNTNRDGFSGDWWGLIRPNLIWETKYFK
jgi:lipopolysaccharide transport system ATP-binding protein